MYPTSTHGILFIFRDFSKDRQAHDPVLTMKGKEAFAGWLLGKISLPYKKNI